MLDPVSIEELRELFAPGELVALLGRVADQIETALTRMRTALQDDEVQELSRAAHELGNSAALIGARTLAAAAAELDPGAAAIPPDSAAERRRRFTAVDDAWMDVRGELERLRSAAGHPGIG